MKPANYSMLLQAASKYNILALTTFCATSCVFCSHHQNPKEVEAYYINKLSQEEALNLVEFLDGSKKIIIGESATRICEGEPFAFEYIIEVLEAIRHKYPQAIIAITTSGTYLEEELLQRLAQLGNIELNISINSCSKEGREKLYGGRSHMQAVRALTLLQNYDIQFNGSIVAMPHLVGWEDIKQTILQLADAGAATIRVFVPGYTRYTKHPLPEERTAEQLMSMVQSLKSSILTPIIVEPSFIDNLNAYIEGVIADTPAGAAELKSGDLILKINNQKPYSRVDAYNRIFELADPEIIFERAGNRSSCSIKKEKKSSSGLVFNYDIHPEAAERIRNTVARFKHKDCLMLTSKLGYEIISKVMETNQRVAIEVASNNYFGGNIVCAGLLVLQDIEDVLNTKNQLSQVVFLPEIMFDEQGRDLTGRHYMELEQKYHITIICN